MLMSSLFIYFSNLQPPVHGKRCNAALFGFAAVVATLEIVKAATVDQSFFWAFIQDGENGGPALLGRETLQNSGAACQKHSALFFSPPPPPSLLSHCILSASRVTATYKFSLE